MSSTTYRCSLFAGKQEQVREAVEQNRKQLRELVEEYSDKEGIIAAFDSEASLEDHSAFVGALKGQLRASEVELGEKRSKFDQQEADVQRDLDRQRGAISRLEQSKELKLQQLNASRRQLRDTRGKLSEAESSVERLAAARAKLERAEAKVKGRRKLEFGQLMRKLRLSDEN